MASAEVTKRRAVKASARAPRVLKQVRSLPPDLKSATRSTSSMSPLGYLVEENWETNAAESPYSSKTSSLETREPKVLEEDENGVDSASSKISFQNASKWDDHSSYGAKKVLGLFNTILSYNKGDLASCVN
jgi:hypothetical protein